MTIQSHWWETRANTADQFWVEWDGSQQWVWDQFVPPAVRVRRVVCAAGVALSRAGAAELADVAWPIAWEFTLVRFEPPTDTYTTVSAQSGALASAVALLPGDPPEYVATWHGGPQLVNAQRDDGAVGEDEGWINYKATLKLIGLQPNGGVAGFVGRYAFSRLTRVYFEQDE